MCTLCCVEWSIFKVLIIILTDFVNLITQFTMLKYYIQYSLNCTIDVYIDNSVTSQFHVSAY